MSRFPPPRSYLASTAGASSIPIPARVDAALAWQAAERLCQLDKLTTRMGPTADAPAPTPVEVVLAWIDDGLVKLDPSSLARLPSHVRTSL